MPNTVEHDLAQANKAAAALMGELAWPTVLFGSGLVAGYVGLLVGFASGYIPLWAAFGGIVVVVYASYTIAHEAVHGSIAGTHRNFTWLNEILGMLGGQILGAPLTAHRKEHLQHHRETNVPGKDPDLMLAGGSLISLLWGTMRALPLQVQYFAENHWKQASVRDRIVLLAELACAISWRLGFVFVAGWKAALLLLVAANLVAIFIILVFFAWIVHHPHTQTGRFKDTSTFVFSGIKDDVVSVLWLFQNYHAIHHLFPRIPFYRYRQLFRKIEATMVAHDAPIVRIGRG